MKNKPSKAIVPAAPDNNVAMGQQLTAQFKKATAGLVDVVVFGAMMTKVQAACRNSDTHLGNADRKGAGLKGWLEKYAPEVQRFAAYEFMKIAEGIREAFSLPAKIDMVALLQDDPAKLTPAQRKKREAILEAIQGKSRRQLLLSFGGVGVPEDDKKKTGGNNGGNDKVLTPEEQAAAAKKIADALWKDSLQAVSNFTKGIHYTFVSADQRTGLIAVLEEAIAKLKKVGA